MPLYFCLVTTGNEQFRSPAQLHDIYYAFIMAPSENEYRSFIEVLELELELEFIYIP
jgi:hypothetical protein